MVGQIIINLGKVAKIIEVCDNGDYIVENPRIGRWRANPMLCTPYNPVEA